MTLTKADLIRQVYDEHEGLTKIQATDAVEAFHAAYVDSSRLERGGADGAFTEIRGADFSECPFGGDDLHHSLHVQRIETFFGDDR